MISHNNHYIDSLEKLFDNIKFDKWKSILKEKIFKINTNFNLLDFISNDLFDLESNNSYTNIHNPKIELNIGQILYNSKIDEKLIKPIVS